ncbi:MAG: hypothetical protein ACOH1N_12190 [Lutibacter sp.]
MSKFKKIKSFTIAEMLVVMVLTTIVISIAILVLNLVQTELIGIQQNFKNNTELRTLEQTLWLDFNKNEVLVDIKSNQLICISPLDTVIYKFAENYVLRNNDTLKLVFEEHKLFLDMKPSLTKADAIELKLSNEFQNKQLFIFKTKSASYYMNKNGF